MWSEPVRWGDVTAAARNFGSSRYSRRATTAAAVLPLPKNAHWLLSPATHAVTVGHTSERHTVASHNRPDAGRQMFKRLLHDERTEAVNVEDKVGARSGSVTKDGHDALFVSYSCLMVTNN
jgi:hypothetical protein